jgi:hypothetical protein
MSASIAANRSTDSPIEENKDIKYNRNKNRNKMSRNRTRLANGSSDEESAKEARKIFPLPVLRHGQRQPSNHASNTAPTLENQVNRTIVVPDDFTYVSELTSPEESYPNELSTTKILTSQNLRALEAGLQQHPPPTQTPKTFPYHPRIEDDEELDDDIAELEVNADDFSYDGDEIKSPKGKSLLLALFCLLVVVAAVAVGIGVSQSQKRENEESSLVASPTGPPNTAGVPTSVPTEQMTDPTSSDPPGIETASPVEAPVDVPEESPTPASSSPPTEKPATSEPGPQLSPAPTALSTPGSTPAPTAGNTSVSTLSPTTEPTSLSTALSTPEQTSEPTASSSPPPTPDPIESSTPATTPAPTEDITGGGSGGCVDQVKATESCYPLGEPITVTFSICEPDPEFLDWIGIYRDDGTLDATNLGEPRYWESTCVTSACQREPYSGTVPLDITDLREATYQLFLVKDDSDSSPYSAFAVGNSFQVSSSC